MTRTARKIQLFREHISKACTAKAISCRQQTEMLTLFTFDKAQSMEFCYLLQNSKLDVLCF